jgi:hypothetical protein
MKSVIQREITPTKNLTYTDHYKWDENQCDFYKDALLEKDSIDYGFRLIVDDEEENRHDSLMEQGIHLYYHYYHHLE